MKIISNIANIQKTIKACRRKGKTIGFVPTMGALHQGHLSLIRRSKKENDISVLSIFVNPAQFGPKEDFQAYPRPTAHDTKLAKQEGVDIIFLPTPATMYPTGYLTFVNVENITDGVLCGKTRPGHFRGVATVVAKLLNIVTPDVMYLGQKDAQQCVVLKRLVSDLHFATRVTICPTVREPDGLAKSSRNQYLAPRQRQEASCLYQSLRLARKQIRNGNRDAAAIIMQMRRHIKNNSSGRIDYVACVDPETLQPLKTIKGKTLLALAVRFGRARLIDNVIVPSYNA